MKRRNFLQLFALLTSSSQFTNVFSAVNTQQLVSRNQLSTSFNDSKIRILGKIPSELTGTLVRFGPRLFDRTAYKQHHLNNDEVGLVKAYQFNEGKVLTNHRFVPESLLKETNSISSNNVNHPVLYRTSNNRGKSYHSNLIKIDTQLNIKEIYKFGKNFVISEPTFIPILNAHNNSKHDGWILSEIYDIALNKCNLVIIDSTKMTSGPIASIQFKKNLPLSHNGIWREETI